MPFSPLKPTRAQWGVLTAAVVGIAYVLLGLEGDDAGRQTLPDGHGSAVAFLEGDSEQLTVDEVAALPEARWHLWAQPGFVPTRQPKNLLWARVRLRNPGPEMLAGVLADTEHFADHVDCFQRPSVAGEPWIHLRSGEWTPAKEKAIWGRENAFPVLVPAHGEQYEDFFGIWLASAWWPQQTMFFAAQQRETIADGLYYGMLLALLFYNAILWVRLRLPPTGSYLLYLGSFTLFMLCARSAPQMLGWPIGSPWIESLLTGFLAASGVFLLSFAETFLELAQRLPRTLRWLRGLRHGMALVAVGSVLAPWLGLTSLLAFPALGCVVAHLAVFGAALASRRAGARQASYFMLAIGALFAGLAPAVFYWLNVLPIRDASRIIMAGSAMEMLLLAVLMSDRLSLLQQEKIVAQKALLAEAEQREIMQEAYAEDLAMEVRERTEELEKAGADKDRILAVLGHDLRSPLTGLTRSAEHWAGRTNGDPDLRTFITEAAHTGRNLLLLIEDLVMWARLRAGTGHVAAHALGALASPVFALQSLQAASSGIALEIQVPDGVQVKTDLVPVQALLRNLLANALQAARCKVRVEAVRLSGSVQISVSDDGPGLPASLAAALDAANPGQLPNGDGLGLRFCLEISRALDLQLSATSAPGGGTEFRFFLPLAPAS